MIDGHEYTVNERHPGFRGKPGPLIYIHRDEAKAINLRGETVTFRGAPVAGFPQGQLLTAHGATEEDLKRIYDREVNIGKPMYKMQVIRTPVPVERAPQDSPGTTTKTLRK